MSGNNLHIRMVIPADAEELLAIYEPYVLRTAIVFEHVVPTVEEFRERIIYTLIRLPYLATVQGGKVVGYAYIFPFELWAAYNWAVGTPIYVNEACRGGDVGTRFCKALEDTLRQQNILSLEAYIAHPNPESIRFHEKYSYKTMAHLTECDYRMGIWYDMI